MLSLQKSLERLPVLWTKKSRVLIASVPRCGSTYLLRSLAGLPQGNTTPKHKSKHIAFVRDLNSLPRSRFLKTHSTAPETLPDDVRTVFLFGDPISAVVSTHEKRNTRDHWLNCGYSAEEEPKTTTCPGFVAEIEAIIENGVCAK